MADQVRGQILVHTLPPNDNILCDFTIIGINLKEFIILFPIIYVFWLAKKIYFDYNLIRNRLYTIYNIQTMHINWRIP